jgi:hypothetical protein
MAELVDAADSKSAVRKDVQVRFLFWARFKNESLVTIQFQGFFVFSKSKDKIEKQKVLLCIKSLVQ